MELSPERGEIWWVALDPAIGSEARKMRPCVVVSVNILNKRRKTVIVVPLSSSPNSSPPILVPVMCDTQPAVAVIDQVRAVTKKRLRARIGVLSEQEMTAVEDSLRQIMNLG